jgi:hypothetical protein
VLKTLILWVTIAAVPTAPVAEASALETLKRSGAWVVDYNRDACHLIAQFGTGPDMIIMRLTRYEPGDWFDLDLYGRRLANTDVRSKATIDFGLRGTPVEALTTNGKTGDLPMMHLGSMRLDGRESEEPEEVGPQLHPPARSRRVRRRSEDRSKKAVSFRFWLVGQADGTAQNLPS